ncbi:hypothetical protein [Streptomyces sp. NBC_00572]|uniref:hypothetical protein n=1 Tax=Streptomyces sp. NBC_00572 TaxID=2903664 RepID=UPI0022536097|nr:hypothetical protein [Streptomyces sp. NBC_00572]MCX4982680.1 hypothetical protein [Streptomyces sp. NBC_00572]
MSGRDVGVRDAGGRDASGRDVSGRDSGRRGEGRTYGRMLWASVLALALEAALALILLVVFGDAGQPEPGEERLSALTLLALPLLTVVWLLPAFAVSAALVLPTVLLGEALTRRAGGRPTGWQLLLSTAAGTLLWPLAGGPGWLVATVCLAVAVLVTRHARRGYFVALLVWGTVTVLTVFLLCTVGLYTGVIDA